MENKPVEIKTCFQFQPKMMVTPSAISGQPPAVNIQFIQCIQENCMAWNFEKKTCKLLKE